MTISINPLTSTIPRRNVTSQNLGLATTPVTLFFRYDDYSERSDPELETRLFSLCRQCGLTLTIGVIPAVCARAEHDPSPQPLLPLSQSKLNLLLNAAIDRTCEIALHGYSHQTIARNLPTEFKGLDLSSQRERILLAKRLLQDQLGHEVKIFIPPWNSYDLVTVRALEDLGFEILSAGYGPAPRHSRLKFLPATCTLHDLPAALSRAKRHRSGSQLIGVLLHDYDFVGYGDTWRDESRRIANVNPIRFEQFAALLNQLLTQPDVAFASIGVLAGSGDDFGPRRLRLNRPLACAPARASLRSERLVYLPTESARRRRVRQRFVAIVFHTWVGTGALGLAWWLSPGGFGGLTSIGWAVLWFSVSLLASLVSCYLWRIGLTQCVLTVLRAVGTSKWLRASRTRSRAPERGAG